MLDGGSDMFGKMMNRYYYGKSGKGDYTKEDLPQTRWQLFWEMLRVRLSGACVYLVGFHRHGQRQLEIWPADGVHHRHDAAFDVRVRYLLR